MTPREITLKLAANQDIFKRLLSGKTGSEYLWRPEPGKWNLLEIVCHLLDEEREDFRDRVKHTLENSLAAMKPINPVGWVLERNYASQDYEKTLRSFLSERSDSVAWLQTLTHANWENAHRHPKLGTLSARLFLVNWLAHDYLHIRQIIRYNYQFLQEQTGMDLQYAGTW